MSNQPSGAEAAWNTVAVILMLVLLIVLLRLRKAGLANSSQVGLAKGQRLRPLAMELIEPLFEVLIVGLLLWDDITRNVSHLIAGLVGIFLGVAIGAYRARILFVRAEPQFKSVVLTRSAAEYVAIVGLVVVKVVAEYSNVQLGTFSSVITALLALVLTESIVRSLMTWAKCRHAAQESARRP